MVALSLHSIVPVRADAREGAEQNTQMLFGELAQVLEEQDRWTRIRLDSDGQEGWVDAKMIAPIAGDDLKAYKAALKKAATVAFPMTYAVSENNGQTIPLTAGKEIRLPASSRLRTSRIASPAAALPMASAIAAARLSPLRILRRTFIPDPSSNVLFYIGFPPEASFSAIPRVFPSFVPGLTGFLAPGIITS